MHILPIIPARFESDRFPGKLLELYKYKSVISWPLRACIEAFGQCLVVTDSYRIAGDCIGECDFLITPTGNYRNGTERIADACNRLNVADDTLIMHVQGDEVGLDPDDLTRLAECSRIHASIRTLYYRTDCDDDVKLLKSTDNVKCWNNPVVPYSGWRFTRAYDATLDKIHVGVYCYRRDALRSYMALWPTGKEKRERLEQLRWDVPIIAYEVAPCKSINVPEDLET